MPVLALLWGFAEATLFFIVPDVFISAVTLRSGIRAGAVASAAAAIGAMLGGLAMYVWGMLDAPSARIVSTPVGFQASGAE